VGNIYGKMKNDVPKKKKKNAPPADSAEDKSYNGRFDFVSPELSDIAEEADLDAEYITGRKAPNTTPITAVNFDDETLNGLAVDGNVYVSKRLPPDKRKSTLRHELIHASTRDEIGGHIGSAYDPGPYPTIFGGDIAGVKYEDSGDAMTTTSYHRLKHPAIAKLIGILNQTNLSQDDKKDYVDYMLLEMSKARRDGGMPAIMSEKSDTYDAMADGISMLNPDEIRGRYKKLKQRSEDFSQIKRR